MNAAVHFGGSPSLQAPAAAPPPVDQGAERNAAWWSGLSAGERQACLQSQPAAIGALDGLPAAARHEANLAVLREDAAGGHDRDGARALLERIENSHNGPEAERILLLAYVPPGPGGSPDARVAVSIGDPDTADNVAVYVPGTGTDLSNIGGSIDRMDDLRAQAELVPSSGTTSTIVWLGYDAPDNLLQATQAGYARDGAPDLRDFTGGLAEARRNPDGRTTVIGHSYGSTVVGTADAMAGRGLATDDIVAMGSPGMGYEAPERRGWFDGPMVDDVSDMHIDAAHFWAGAAANDPVTYTEVHGNSPVDWSFGGQRISTDGASGHSEYWEPGTEALRNQAYIVTGRYAQVDTVRRRLG